MAAQSALGEEMAVPPLVQIAIRHAGAGESPHGWKLPVLKSALGALAVLSSDERNLAQMRSEGMEQQVEKYLRAKDEKLQAFARQLIERLFQDR